MTVLDLPGWVLDIVVGDSMLHHTANVVQQFAQSLLFYPGAFAARQGQEMLDTQGRTVGIGLPCSALLRRIEAEATLWQVHALEPLVPDENGGFVVACDFYVVLVSDIASIHGQDLGRCLLYSAIGVFGRALDEELEGSFQPWHGL